MDPKKFLKKMTVADKARLLCGTKPFAAGGFESAAGYIPVLNMQDGGTGINFEQLFPNIFTSPPEGYTHEEAYRVIQFFYKTGSLTPKERVLRDKLNEELTKYRDGIDAAPGCYPPGILLASTWDPEVIRQTGRALGMEAAVYRTGVLLGTPNVNILRDPLNGRFFEGYSEDPFLARTLAPEMCAGVEEAGVASNVKHFACNNLEINRMRINGLVSPRALREVYLPAFEACCKVAKTLMTAYPSLNGRHCNEDPWLLKEVLRKEWGYNGVTITDWGACTGNTGDSASSGQDLFMPGPWDPSDIVKATEDGRLSAKDLDEAALRILKLTAAFSDIRKPADLTSAKYRKTGDRAAYKAASEGIVMLKNNGSMPLKKKAGVVFWDKFPDRFKDYGTGSAQVFTDRTTVLSDELAAVIGEKHVLRNDIKAFRKGATAVIIETIDSAEGTDRHDLKLSKKTAAFIKKLGRERGKGRICLILNVPGPVELDGIEKIADSIFTVFYPGMMGGRAMADIMTGRVNPSGALPCTFPVSYKDAPSYLSYPDSYTCNYGEGIYVGYKGYIKRGIKPLYPFGYGLSYSKFKVSDIKASKTDGKVRVSFSISNKGRYDGKAVVQLYSSKRKPVMPRADVELTGFVKTAVRAGESSKAVISFDQKELAYYDERFGRFLTEEGAYDLFLSVRGCTDLIPAGSIYVDSGSPELKCGPLWTCGAVAELSELTEALREDCIREGLEYMAFISACKYEPFRRLSEIYKDTGRLSSFMAAAGKYRPE